MAYVTYGTASELVASRPARKSFFARLMKALHLSRMRQAQCELAFHRHLLPAELEHAGLFLDSRSEKQLPFIRD